MYHLCYTNNYVMFTLLNYHIMYTVETILIPRYKTNSLHKFHIVETFIIPRKKTNSLHKFHIVEMILIPRHKLNSPHMFHIVETILISKHKTKFTSLQNKGLFRYMGSQCGIKKTLQMFLQWNKEKFTYIFTVE